MKDLYQILGVSKTASQDDIKNAYRKLARKFHPDLNPGNKKAEESFKEINSANDILSNPEMRAKYDSGEIDASGAAQRQYSGASAGGGPFYYETQQGGGRYSSPFEGMDSDIFESIFRNSRNRPRDFAGEDQMYSLAVDFKDAVLGTEQEITLPTGKKLKVKIPGGIESGKKLRFKGLGGPGVGKGPAGDAYVEITVRPSDLFKRVDKNLELEVPISIYEAVLGGEVRVPTLESPVLLKVPAGASTGTKLRVKGKGVVTSGERGDLIVSLKIVMPAKVDEPLQEALRKLSADHSYNPRESLNKEGKA